METTLTPQQLADEIIASGQELADKLKQWKEIESFLKTDSDVLVDWSASEALIESITAFESSLIANNWEVE